MTKITLSQYTPEAGGPLHYTVLVDAQPVMASTPLFTRAGAVLAQQVRAAAQRQQGVTVVRWDGDAGIETPWDWSALANTTES